MFDLFSKKEGSLFKLFNFSAPLFTQSQIKRESVGIFLSKWEDWFCTVEKDATIKSSQSPKIFRGDFTLMFFIVLKNKSEIIFVDRKFPFVKRVISALDNLQKLSFLFKMQFSFKNRKILKHDYWFCCVERDANENQAMKILLYDCFSADANWTPKIFVAECIRKAAADINGGVGSFCRLTATWKTFKLYFAIRFLLTNTFVSNWIWQ